MFAAVVIPKRSLIIAVFIVHANVYVIRMAERTTIAAFRHGNINFRRGEEAVGEIDCASVQTYILSPADEAAPVGGFFTQQFTRECAAFKINMGEVGVQQANETAITTVAVLVAVDANAAHTVLDEVSLSESVAYKAAGVL